MYTVILKIVTSLSLALFALASHALSADNEKTPSSTNPESRALKHSNGQDLGERVLTTEALVGLQGVAQPVRDAELRSPVVGTVIAIHVEDGDWVEAGQALVTIDDRIAKANLLSAQQEARATAALRQAELEAKRTQQLLARTEQAHAAGASNEYEVEAKRNEWLQAEAAAQVQREQQEQAKARLAIARAELAQRTLAAPFAGRILEVRARIGSTLDAESVAVRVADLTEIRTEMFLPMHFYKQIEVGSVYELRAGSPIDAPVKARAKFVSPAIEPTSSTFRVLFEIANSDQSLPAGVELWFGQ